MESTVSKLFVCIILSLFNEYLDTLLSLNVKVKENCSNCYDLNSNTITCMIHCVVCCLYRELSRYTEALGITIHLLSAEFCYIRSDLQ